MWALGGLSNRPICILIVCLAVVAILLVCVTPFCVLLPFVVVTVGVAVFTVFSAVVGRYALTCLCIVIFVYLSINLGCF